MKEIDSVADSFFMWLSYHIALKSKWTVYANPKFDTCWAGLTSGFLWTDIIQADAVLVIDCNFTGD